MIQGVYIETESEFPTILKWNAISKNLSIKTLEDIKSYNNKIKKPLK
jgi:hypothetical protein